MAIEFTCPTCGQTLQAQDQHAGMQVNCPRCQGLAVIPSGPSPAGAGPPGPPASPGAGPPPPVPPQTFQPPWLPKTKTSGLAIAALILCLFPPTYVIGFILAIAALVTIPRRPDRSGTGLAIVGMVVGAVIPVIAALIAILLPSLGSAREAARRAKCHANLRGLANVMKIYASQNNGQYPAVARGRRADGTEMAVRDGVDTQASLWLLVTGRLVSPESFICPSDQGATPFLGEASPDQPFPQAAGRRSWSYSYQIPNGDVGNPGKDNPNSTRFAIMADRAPVLNRLTLLPDGSGGSVGAADYYLTNLKAVDGRPGATSRVMFNSPNHGGSGQSVLFQDGHVAWKPHPWCGIRDDNIYTWAADDTAAGRIKGRKPESLNAVTDLPASDDDSVLVNILEGVPCTEP